jgi:Fe-S-cluster-containing hydrogenase component 2/CRP-like cAMP-binding protein
MARLEPREGDIPLPKQLLPKVPPFTQEMAAKGLEKIPRSVVLHRYRAGEIICRQGAPGWTAFYILTPEEVAAYRRVPRQMLEADAAERAKVQAELDVLCAVSPDDKKLASLADKVSKLVESCATWAEYTRFIEAAIPEQHLETGKDEEPLLTARVYLALPRTDPKPSEDVYSRVERFLMGTGPVEELPRPKYIPVDGPCGIDYESREGQLYAGQIFGEMSCMLRTPRSATVVAARDCYVLEMLRNVFDRILADNAKLRERIDRDYRARVLELQLRALPILNVLDERLMTRVRQEAELVEYPAGHLLFDEHEPPDGMYLIRGGIVEVARGVSSLVSAEQLGDVLRLENDGPGHEVWDAVPEPLRTSLASGDRQPGTLAELAGALNELLKDPDLRDRAGFRDLARSPKIIRPLWKELASSSRASDHDRARLNRVLLEAIKIGLPRMEIASAGDAEEAGLLRAREVRDPAGLAASLWVDESKPDETPVGRARRRVWSDLPATVCTMARLAQEAKKAAAPAASGGPAALRAKKAAGKPAEATPEAVERVQAFVPTDEQIEALAAALNGLIAGPPLLLDPAFDACVREDSKDGRKLAASVREYLPSGTLWTHASFHRHSRAYNRALVETKLPGLLKARPRAGGPSARILAYRSRGEYVGEASLVTGRPRNATCVAFSHPEGDPDRDEGLFRPVQLVRMSAELFHDLAAQSAEFRRLVAEEVARQQAQDRREAEGARRHPRSRGHDSVAAVERDLGALVRTPRGEELGLIQGQKLMVIDLDRCTRCDECVTACVATHADGRSRLFLDGPRVGKYLVPSSCRSCLDPVCMIGCPVGSIHRGENGQIQIRDWCIGCKTCADQCPYGSIQMHDIGVVAEHSHTWLYRPAPADGDDRWTAPGTSARGWQAGSSPFSDDLELRSVLGISRGSPSRAVQFRHEFDLAREQLGRDARFRFTIQSADERFALWVNGRAVLPAEPGAAQVEGVGAVAMRDRRGVGFEFSVEVSPPLVRTGRNVLATRAVLSGGLLMSLRLDEARPVETLMGFIEDDATKAIELRAVVCDQCSTLPGRRPACVAACPHDAAFRVDARSALAAM